LESKGMTILLDKLSDGAFGIPRTEAIAMKICVICKDPITEFRDDLSAKEYKISGLCPGCQDEVFGA
jgi:hypothetical protein